jgi:hypothetical protein
MRLKLTVVDRSQANEGDLLEELIGTSDVRSAANLLRDSRTVIAIGFFPLLGLLVIPRLVQWYRLSARYPVLTLPIDSELMTDQQRLICDFQEARLRFWFAVLFWPVIAMLTWIACVTV